MLFLLPLHTSSIDLSVGRSHAIRHQFSRSHDLPNFAVYDHVMSLLKEPHWLRVPERIEFKLCALVYKKCLNGSGPAYLADSLQQVTDAQLRQRLRSSSSSWLVVPVTRHATLGDRVGTPYQTSSVTAAPTVASFCAALKTYLFSRIMMMFVVFMLHPSCHAYGLTGMCVASCLFLVCSRFIRFCCYQTVMNYF